MMKYFSPFTKKGRKTINMFFQVDIYGYIRTCGRVNNFKSHELTALSSCWSEVIFAIFSVFDVFCKNLPYVELWSFVSQSLKTQIHQSVL